MAPTTPRSSPWAASKMERFGRGSIYERTKGSGASTTALTAKQPPPSPTKHDVALPPVMDVTDVVQDLQAYIAESERHLGKMKELLREFTSQGSSSPSNEKNVGKMKQLLCEMQSSASRYPSPAPLDMPLPEPHPVASGGDVLEEVLFNVPSIALCVTSEVCVAWRDASDAARQRLGPAVHPMVITSLMAEAADFRSLMRLAAVCTTWKAAAYAERAEWRRAVEREAWSRAADRDYLPVEISTVPFVDKVLRINTRIGTDTLTNGGLVGSVLVASRVLGLTLDPISRRALDESPGLTLIARPDAAGMPNSYVVAGLERISDRVLEIADILAMGLIVVGSNEDEEEARLARAAPLAEDDVDNDEARQLLDVVGGFA